MTDVDLLIVGGGPAGMAAARLSAEHGLSVAVVDEQQRPGGQILRQPPASFAVDGWLNGASYKKMRAELAAFARTSGIAWYGGRSVIGLERDASGFVVQAAGIADMLRITADRLLIATGCYDLPVPLPGCTLPGVMAAGGVQAFLKSQQVVPGQRFVLAGTHPLMLIIASQIVLAGGEVALVAFDQPLLEPLRVLLRRGASAVRHIGTLAAAAGALRILRRHGVPVRYGMPLRAITGLKRVEAAAFDDRAVRCDTVALCYGFVPQSDLPRMAGASIEWAPPAGGWRTCHDAWMRTDIPRLSVAGETSGVAGAEVAMEEGRLAALGFIEADGARAEAARAAVPIRRRLAHLRGFTDMLAEIADPHRFLQRAVAPDTIVCRCENVRHGTISAALREETAPNAIKLATRCGMGLCQGRSCEVALLRLISQHTGRPPAAPGGFTARFPARPTRIGDIIAPIFVADIATNSSPAHD